MTKELNRRLFLSSGATASVAALAFRMGFGLSESGPAQERQSARGKAWTLALEEYAKRGCNYCDRMVDKNGLPYFDVFWTDPAEAAHDWPDFGDVMSRQFQAVVMARHMTGEVATIEPVWRQKILSLIDAETGLLTRPETSYSRKVADDGDQALTLYALVTAYVDSPDRDLRNVIVKMTDGLLARAPVEARCPRHADGLQRAGGIYPRQYV